jgi:hypothetical protein|tara:strand:- start:3975 stop:4295 length:321 start_codon:yes stop_codon:yes gene_type:complete
MADQNNKPEEKDDIMDRIAQMQMDQILLEKAFNNSYLILSGQITFDELISKNFKRQESMIMAFDPDNGPSEDELQNMIDHYIDEENYERCAKLQVILDKTYPTINE